MAHLEMALREKFSRLQVHGLLQQVHSLSSSLEAGFGLGEINRCFVWPITRAVRVVVLVKYTRIPICFSALPFFVGGFPTENEIGQRGPFVAFVQLLHVWVDAQLIEMDFVHPQY